MKKFLFALLLTFLILSTVSCGNVDSEAVTESPIESLGNSPSVSQEISTEKETDVGNDKLSDEELSALVWEEAERCGYNVYDTNDIKRVSLDSRKPTIDLPKTLSEIKKNDGMASTRFVFKGSKMADTDSLAKVAEYETPLLSKSPEALHNMQLANETLNGLIVEENEEFSFIFFLGAQTAERGYQEATVFVHDDKTGEVKEEKAVGGGICQVSSTLHAACLAMNLNITERHAHSKKVRYIEEGLDAAIAGEYYDLKFINNYTGKIALFFTMEDGYERVEIYSAQ